MHDYRDPNSGFDGSERSGSPPCTGRPAALSISSISTRRCTFTADHPELPESIRALKRAVDFTKQHIPVK